MRKIELKINDKIVSSDIPESWQELTVRNFITLKAIDKMNWQTPFEKDVAIISSFLNIEKDVIEMLDLNEFNELITTMSFLSEELVFPPVADTIDFNGKTYYIKKDFDTMSVGERITFDVFLRSTKDVDEQLDLFLCLFLKESPDEKWHNDHKLRRQTFLEFPFINVRPVLDFFLTGIGLLNPNTKPSLENQKSQKKMKQENEGEV